MRISDWSSDVCSSDLNTVAEVFQLGNDNVSSINQAGNFSNAAVSQTGDRNSATGVRQSADGTGDGNPASAPVVPDVFADALVSQNADDNVASITQAAVPAFASRKRNGLGNDSARVQTGTATAEV